MMPKVHGFDVCARVKKEWNMHDVYVVMLTGRGQESDREKGFEFGADRYITKPIKTQEIAALAREVLGI
jgi:DNA-binding response OmpR family regulator